MKNHHQKKASPDDVDNDSKQKIIAYQKWNGLTSRNNNSNNNKINCSCSDQKNGYKFPFYHVSASSSSFSLSRRHSSAFLHIHFNPSLLQRNLTIINYAEECCMAPFMTFESTGFRFYILDMTVALSTIDLQMCRSLCVCVCLCIHILYKFYSI